MSDPCLLIGDIGGTNARFALADASEPGFSEARTLRCADFDTAHDAVRAYLDQQDAPRPLVVCLAGAGPVENDAIVITNNHWELDRGHLARDLGAEQVRLLNDFEAVAYAIPLLEPRDTLGIGTQRAAIAGGDFTACAIGPGTGLGGVGVLRRNGDVHPLACEAGHVGFAPESETQLEMLKLLRERFARVSVERLVSGSGIVNVYWALSKLAATGCDEELSPADIFARASSASDDVAVQAVDMFFEMLGQVAGDMALNVGAWDGVFLAGGIAQRYPDALSSSRFRQGFENKGRHRHIMEGIPTELIVRDEPGLLGASQCARVLYENAAAARTE